MTFRWISGPGLLLALIALSLTASPVFAQEQDSVRYVGSSGTLSRMVIVGNTVYLSGVLGTRAGPGVKEQATQIMESIRTSLTEVGATMDNVVKCTVYMADLSERPQFNEVYSSFFPTNKPARSAVGVDLGGPKVEVECMAVLPPKP